VDLVSYFMVGGKTWCVSGMIDGQGMLPFVRLSQVFLRGRQIKTHGFDLKFKTMGPDISKPFISSAALDISRTSLTPPAIDY